MTKVAGKTIYITGAAGGMGLIAGKMLANRGAHVLILDNDPTDCALRDIESACLTAEQRVTRYRLNISDRAMVIETIRVAVAEFGVPDILINMAGIGSVQELIEMKFEAFDRVIQINLYGARHIVEAVLPRMIARGSGKIVLVGSLGGIVPVFGYTAYGASKFGVVALAQCLRYEPQAARDQRCLLLSRRSADARAGRSATKSPAGERGTHENWRNHAGRNSGARAGRGHPA